MQEAVKKGKEFNMLKKLLWASTTDHEDQQVESLDI